MGWGNILQAGFDAFNEDPEEAENMAYQGQPPEAYEDRATEAIPAEVFMISGCMDKQTSADVSDVSSFQLPDDAGPGGAGGACTNALLRTAYRTGDVSWVQLLQAMQGYLKQRGYSQVPQLSTSRRLDLNDPFEMQGGYAGTHKALLIGINYVRHSSGRLSGCINDVLSMKEYIEGEGFEECEDTMRILIDDPDDEYAQDRISIPTDLPTRDNILDGVRWLVEDAQPGDVLFVHYSGHGSQMRDTTGDEEDGKDETLCPDDYNTAGMIIDDTLFQELVAPLPPGVRLICLMDCCHSGTILDLPFQFAASDNNLAQVAAGKPAKTYANPGFGKTMNKIMKMGGEQLMKKYGGSGGGGMLGFAQQFGLF
eukprot:TRINITY_DN72007_c0_g1_i1.p2 TRINITY_DN72007_c0_g1~~TRINITY_DN72007_c0_g1_i1.p2  ORF type:complete len:395 (+),score=126.00 TRINITY_DN72007_c0_g1_i1:86-1186(+)